MLTGLAAASGSEANASPREHAKLAQRKLARSKLAPRKKCVRERMSKRIDRMAMCSKQWVGKGRGEADSPKLRLIRTYGQTTITVYVKTRGEGAQATSVLWKTDKSSSVRAS